MKFLIVVGFLILSLSTFGSTKQYSLAEKTVVGFHLPFTLGTHDGEAIVSKGKVVLDFKDPILSSGELSVAIESMTTGNTQRDCHLREALGLNYESSDFPKDHVCNDQNQLPLTGKNAVVYPEINFKILSLKSLDKSGEILTDHETPIEVEGLWSIHGITRKEKLTMKIIPKEEKLSIQGETSFLLKNYNIQVKPGKVLFMTIAVKDQVKVSLDVLLTPN